MNKEIAVASTVIPEPASRHLPGEVGIWVLILGDLVLFSVLFVLLLVYCAGDMQVFAESQAKLSQKLGLLNTVLMLTSSWCVATAVQAARRQVPRVTSVGFGLALLCGLGFVVVKYFEYSAKIEADITPVTNQFFMIYFVYTVIHLIHVVIGMCVLTALAIYSRSGEFSAKTIQHLESGASFWHLVDMLWIVLFALLYLVPY